MKPIIHHVDGTSTVTFSDERGDEESQIGREILHATPEGDVILDFRKVRYLNSMDVGAIVAFRNQVIANDGRLTLINLNQPSREVLQVTCVDKILRIK